MIQILRETHETLENVAHRLERAGGTNRFGEANYRAVWGWNRLAWIGGKFAEHDSTTGSLLREVIGLRQEPKYPAVNRWHIERWVPPEIYGSPRLWYAQTIERENGVSIPALGPFPSRGEYEHCFTLEGPSGEFIQLTPTAAEHIARAIEFSRRFSRSLTKRSLDDRARNEERAYESWAYDQLDDAVPAFHKQPFVTVA
ncbi:MAG TPA: hypothetical protein VMI32_17160 [Candidatus Solibacter sp.]|nr:hypothetical protein [Candidatus Solibacter sp.]